MRHRALFLVSCLILAVGGSPAAAQSSKITGRVVNSKTGKPLPNANVFLDGTMRGDVTNEKGRFQIENVPPGSYLIVISRVGYDIRRGRISVSQGKQRRFQVKLHPNPIDMPGVTVEGNRSTWLERLKRFRTYFFGETPIAEKCQILNPEVLSFEVAADTLKVYAEEPLRVENQTLGYNIEYYIRRFAASEDRLQQDVFARFREMEPTSRQQKTAWAKARTRAYRGSFQHFVRAVARGTFEDEGFRVYTSTQQRYYYGRDPVKRLDGLDPVHDASAISQPAPQPVVLRLSFSADFLRVEYPREREPRAYRRARLPEEIRQTGNKQLSWISLPRGYALVDIRSGRSFRTHAPVFHGYWAWAERESTALPRDYEPKQ